MLISNELLKAKYLSQKLGRILLQVKFWCFSWNRKSRNRRTIWKLLVTVFIWTTFRTKKSLYQLLQWPIKNFPQGKLIVRPFCPGKCMIMKEIGLEEGTSSWYPSDPPELQSGIIPTWIFLLSWRLCQSAYCWWCKQIQNFLQESILVAHSLQDLGKHFGCSSLWWFCRGGLLLHY